jgi:predicted amidohydrolase
VGPEHPEREHSVAVLLAQLPPSTNDVLTSAHRIGELLTEHPEAELAVFPELYLSGNSLHLALESAVTTSSRAVQRIREAARRTHTAVVVGMVERSAGFPCDAALCVDEEGDVAGVYRKVHLAPEEHRYLAPGSSFVVVPLAGVRVAPMMAADLSFPESTRGVARAGCELLVTLGATEDADAAERAMFVRARAVENRTPHVYVNRVGDESGRRYSGESVVIDAGGDLLAGLVPLRPEVRVVEVPVGGTVEPHYPHEAVDVPVLGIADHPSSRGGTRLALPRSP